MINTIADFHIRPVSEERFTVELFARWQSQPLAATAFDWPVSFFTGYEVEALDFDDKDPAARLERQRAFGGKLFQKLFSAEAQKQWHELKTRSDFLVACLRIASDAAKLEALPWETLFDGEEFIAAGAKTSVSRLPLDVAPRDALPAVPLPVRMLALVASPLDLKENQRLRIEEEQEILLRAINTPAGQGRLHADFEDEAKLEILESSLEAAYHVFHYTGHGIAAAQGGGLLLENAQGESRPITVAEFMNALQKGESTLRLAVMSGCQTARTLHIAGFRDLARGLIRRIPAVIAMQFSISDAAGLAFAEALYPRLVAGQPLEMAVSAARRALLQSDNPYVQADALAPVLLTSNGECLKTREADAPQVEQPKIDFSFHLPLPQLSFGFYGRRREYRQIRDGLLYRNHRAVIVQGIGGIGKTALVSHVATRLRSRFRGVYAFDCSSGMLSPERILFELNQYFVRQGVRAFEPLMNQNMEPDQLAGFIGQVFSQWPLLVIFDNFESQLMDDGAEHKIESDDLRVFLITLLKTTATSSKFLFTTRYLFDLDSKRLGNIQELQLGDLSTPEALGLMQKLPHLMSASYGEKMAALERFGGHPYALVALNAHCSFRPLSKVLEEAASVHTELREFLVIELNYSKLTEQARELLNRLSAFREPVPLGAAEWVMGKNISYTAEDLQQLDRNQMPEAWKQLDEAELLKRLDARLPERRQAGNLERPIAELIGWGLLTPIYEGEMEGLAVHALVRDFSRDKQGSETWRIRLRDAAAFYTNQTKHIQVDQKTQAMVWSEMEAFELLTEAEDYEEAASLLIAATELLDRWGFGRHLEMYYRSIMPRVEKANQSILIHNFGYFLANHGDYEAALRHYQESQEVFEELGDRVGIANSLHQIGNLHLLRGDYDGALRHYEKSLRIKEELGDRAGVGYSYGQIGNLHYNRGEYEVALRHYDETLKIAKELNDQESMAKALHQIGMIYESRGVYDEALRHYEESRKIKEELGDRAGIAKSLHQIGNLHYFRGDYEAALQHYNESLKIKEKLGNRAGMAISLAQIGKMFSQTEHYPEAFQRLLFALSTFVELQSPNARIVAGMLKELRGRWGAENFDAAWQKATGGDVPDEWKS
jgi:tetratricopeptide (TPR) repeat protein